MRKKKQLPEEAEVKVIKYWEKGREVMQTFTTERACEKRIIQLLNKGIMPRRYS